MVRVTGLLVAVVAAVALLPASALADGDGAPGAQLRAVARSAFGPAGGGVDITAARRLLGAAPDPAASRQPAALQTWQRARVERQGFFEASYTDVCDDAGSPLDLRWTAFVEDSDTGDRLIGAGSCTPWTVADLGTDGGVLWRFGVPGGRGTGPDYIGLLVADGNGLAFGVLRTPSDDPGTWQLTYEDPAVQRPDAYDAVANFPLTALEGHREFVFDVTSTDAAGREDLLPEAHEVLLLYPYSCNLAFFDRATVATAPSAFGTAVRSARALGLRVASQAPAIGTFEVRGLGQRPGTWQALRAAPGVTAVTGVRPLARMAVTPDDPAYARQWALGQVGAPAAWDTRTASDLVLAVIDDGVDAARPDLAGRVLAGRDTVFDVPLAAGVNSDRGGHGSAVAGIAAAQGDNGVEMTGLDWGARVLPVRVSDAAGCISEAAVAAAITWAADQGAHVINVSLGSTEPLAVIERAVAHATAKGALVVAAAGNDIPNNQMVYPAALDGVVAVGATTRSGAVATYSNRNSSIDIVAPGGDGSGSDQGDVLSFAERQALAPLSGTSFSAPLVAAAALLYRAGVPDATPAQVAAALTASARDAGPAGRDDGYGHGILDVAALLAGTGGPAPPPVGGSRVPPAGFDGDPATTERILSGDAVRAAVGTSRARFPDGSASHAVLVRADAFADALAGTPLAADGPMLLTLTGRLPDFVLAELERVLAPGGTVYLLGGEVAISAGVADHVAAAGFEVRRLAGPDRVATALHVADEVVRLYPDAPRVALVARAYGRSPADTAAWADSVTGGAWAAAQRVPLLLTPTEVLSPAVRGWLTRRQVSQTVLLGGPAALSGAVESAAPAPRRVAGSDRAHTAVRISRELWRVGPFGGRRYLIVDGYRPDGWAFGLPAAGLAADFDAPTLVVAPDGPSEHTLGEVVGCDQPRVDLLVLGSEAIVPAATVGALDARDGVAC